MSYRNSFKLPVKIIRPFNTFGPRQSSRAIIPTIILQALNNKDIKLGNLKPTRDFLFIQNTIDAYYEIVKSKNFFGKVVNVGSGKEISIGQLVNLIKKKLSSKSKVIIENKRIRTANSEVDRLVCNNALIKKNTNWKVSTSFEKGLDETIEWFKNNNNTEVSKIYNI